MSILCVVECMILPQHLSGGTEENPARDLNLGSLEYEARGAVHSAAIFCCLDGEY